MRQTVGREFQYRSNMRDYYKLYVQQPNGSMYPGSRTLRAFAGSTLQRKAKELQCAIDRGVWGGK